MKTKKTTVRTSTAAGAPRKDASLDALLDRMDFPAAKETHAHPGPMVVEISAFDPKGRPLVKIPGASSKPIAARSTVRVTSADAGREALIVFENGDPSKPVITGLLETPGGAPQTDEADGIPKKIILQAGQEFTIKCGSASITLTKDGRVVIRGADVLTRSSGSNRIKGGSVHIN